ncbi:MAG: hypothetical protein QXJ31_01715 [Candidatus Bathyarchaeia archaeon]
MKFNGERAWETMKLSLTLSSALTTVIVSLLGVINYLPIDGFTKAFSMLVPLLVGIIMKEFVNVAERNFERECRRMYENIAILMKIEAELPSRKDKRDDRNFKEETNYLPLAWEKCKFSNTEQFVDEMLKRNNSFYSSMKPIFSILRKVAYLLMAIVCSIILITIVSTLSSFL